ncbi:hypothetical protein ACJU26_05820 [Acidithiobacillus sp. M4-SHS-6]|uniref:hypothetical protein n=1 Tax=Acidithiobacillus sp. M4-SHS-6 TaxID=3383024 RepID=UPI0039BDC237
MPKTLSCGTNGLVVFTQKGEVMNTNAVRNEKIHPSIMIDGMNDTEIFMKLVSMAKSYFPADVREKILPFVVPVPAKDNQ